MTCNATPPGYQSELPSRCHLTRGHDGDHTARTGWGPNITWPNEESEAA